jgi:hypothetical protein
MVVFLGLSNHRNIGLLKDEARGFGLVNVGPGIVDPANVRRSGK